jgi:hypothetical protein
MSSFTPSYNLNPWIIDCLLLTFVSQISHSFISYSNSNKDSNSYLSKGKNGEREIERESAPLSLRLAEFSNTDTLNRLLSLYDNLSHFSHSFSSKTFKELNLPPPFLSTPSLSTPSLSIPTISPPLYTLLSTPSLSTDSSLSPNPSPSLLSLYLSNLSYTLFDEIDRTGRDKGEIDRKEIDREIERKPFKVNYIKVRTERERMSGERAKKEEVAEIDKDISQSDPSLPSSPLLSPYLSLSSSYDLLFSFHHLNFLFNSHSNLSIYMENIAFLLRNQGYFIGSMWDSQILYYKLNKKEREKAGTNLERRDRERQIERERGDRQAIDRDLLSYTGFNYTLSLPHSIHPSFSFLPFSPQLKVQFNLHTKTNKASHNPSLSSKSSLSSHSPNDSSLSTPFYLAHWPSFIEIASKFDLECVFQGNALDFYTG